jgi:hypothetical protein
MNTFQNTLVELPHELRRHHAGTRIDGDLHAADLLVDVLHKLQHAGEHG